MRSNPEHGAVHLMGRLAIATTALACHFAHADRLWPIDQRFNATIGAFLLDTDTTLRVDGETNIGTEVNLEDTFDFDEQSRLRIDGYWRFAERHKVRFMYFSSRSEASRTASRVIEFQDATFPADAFVRAEFETQVIELAYEYAFMRRDSWEIAASVGLHNLQVKTGLSAQISSAVGTGQVDRSAQAKADGPLPVIGLHGTWAFSDHWYLDAQAQFFGIEVDEYDGSLQDYKLTVVWMPLRNFGVGVGYNDFSTHLDVDADRFHGKMRFGYGGPIGFITVAF